MPEAHVKPCYMLEHLKAPSASNAKISGIKVDFVRDFDKVEYNKAVECCHIPRPLITTIPLKEEIVMTNPTLSLFPNENQPEIGNQQVTRIELGWLAGFIDGEGYIGIQRYKTKHNHICYSVAMQVTNTDEAMILRAQSIIQKIGVNPYIRTHGYGVRNQPDRKVVYVLVVHRMKPLETVLKKVTPFLSGKKQERAILVLEYCISRSQHFIKGSHYNVMTERETQIVDLCIAKQQRGTSETTRKAQLERKNLMLAKAYLNKQEYVRKWKKDPVNHARAMESQRIRRGTFEGREKEREYQKEYRRRLNIRRKDSLRSMTDDDIVRPFAKA